MEKAVRGMAIAHNFGEDRMSSVPDQAFPNADFPTVAYPNPEEHGALDLATSRADTLGFELVIANDPDADRLAVAQKVDGEWIQFTGDQVGVLLAHYLISRQPSAAERAVESPYRPRYMLASAVSSQMLSRIALAADICFEETLTGFKWLASKAACQFDSDSCTRRNTIPSLPRYLNEIE